MGGVFDDMNRYERMTWIGSLDLSGPQRSVLLTSAQRASSARDRALAFGGGR